MRIHLRRAGIILGLSSLAAAASFVPPPLDKIPGTLALYQFDEGNDDATADESGFDHQGLLGGTSAWASPVWVPDDGDWALDFASPSAVVKVLTPIEVTPEWTIQGWTRFPLDSNDNWERHFASSSNYGGWNAHVAAKGGELGVWGATFPFYGSGVQLSSIASGWHLLTAVGSGGKTKFYIDGVAVGTSEYQVLEPIAMIGGVDWTSYSWGGVIDNLRVLNYARSAGDIVTDANGPIFLPPPVPTNLAQPVPAGGSVANTFDVSATVTGGYTLHVEAEFTSVASGSTQAFSSPTVTSGATATVVVSGLAAGPWRWQARAVDANGSSPWVTFGAGGTDIVVTANAAPTGSAAGLLDDRTGAPIVALPISDRDLIRFQATATDPNNDAVRLQVEVRADGGVFTGAPTATGEPVASGATAACRVSVSRGRYAWRWRVVDTAGATSSWSAAGTGEFTVQQGGSLGPAGCAANAAGGGSWLAVVALVAFVGIVRR